MRGAKRRKRLWIIRATLDILKRYNRDRFVEHRHFEILERAIHWACFRKVVKIWRFHLDSFARDPETVASHKALQNVHVFRFDGIPQLSLLGNQDVPKPTTVLSFSSSLICWNAFGLGRSGRAPEGFRLRYGRLVEVVPIDIPEVVAVEELEADFPVPLRVEPAIAHLGNRTLAVISAQDRQDGPGLDGMPAFHARAVAAQYLRLSLFLPCTALAFAPQPHWDRGRPSRAASGTLHFGHGGCWLLTASDLTVLSFCHGLEGRSNELPIHLSTVVWMRGTGVPRKMLTFSLL